ncbi:hypothetical protein [Methylorubrum extorquens]|uniref:Uncharacterized protein n=1 Tax=Methylorubrum extorquens TaxID=408 RepID=A0AAX3WDD0_METEX|nr:hypothetical protein [Methylorubrum extorquens]WHQ69489.1 hypothetical protein KEC54_24640 [Methylorubrum extorquens]
MRTIIEIDNGSAAAISGGGKDLADLLARALMTGSDAAWDRLRPYLIKRLVERYPTEPAKVVVGERMITVR